MHRTIAIAALAGITGSASAQLTFFENRADWEAAVGAFNIATLDGLGGTDFTGSSLNSGGITITHEGLGGARIDLGGTFGDLDGTDFLEAETGSLPGGTVTFTFDGGPVNAFGADFFSPFSGAGINLVAGGESIALDYIAGFDQGFGGFTSAAGISSVQIVINGDNGVFQELWSADNLSYRIVPAPGSAALLGAAGLLTARRRR